VLETTGGVRNALWVTYRLLEPKFDNPDAQMPNLGISRAEAETMATYLVGGQVQNRFQRIAVAVFGGMRGLVLTAVGFVGGVTTGAVLAWLSTKRRTRLKTRLDPRS
jgi:hypothetical protein